MSAPIPYYATEARLALEAALEQFDLGDVLYAALLAGHAKALLVLESHRQDAIARAAKNEAVPAATQEDET